MNPFIIGSLGIAAMFVLILLHVPIGIAMAIIGLVGVGLLDSFQAGFSIIGVEAASALGNVDLAVIPLFMLMGNFATVAGISREMYDIAHVFLGHRRGGLAMATIAGCGLFGSVCGSSYATTATFGRVALPEMIERGYSQPLATGCIAGGGTLGSLVPPSVILVIYAVLAEEFIIRLFVAAILPALLTILIYFLATAIYVRIYPQSAPSGAPSKWSERVKILRKSWSALLLILAVAGGIYGGVFTVTEAAALAAILSVFLAFVRGKMTLPKFWEALTGSATSAGMIYVVIMGAMSFNYFIVMSHLPDFLTGAIIGSGWSNATIMLLLLVSYIVLGAIFDSGPAMIITLPFVLPIIKEMGYSPVWWGIINVVICEIGCITPPIGLTVFMLHGVAPEYSLSTIYKGILPYLFADFVRITLLVLFPIIALWLPGLLSG